MHFMSYTKVHNRTHFAFILEGQNKYFADVICMEHVQKAVDTYWLTFKYYIIEEKPPKTAT